MLIIDSTKPREARVWGIDSSGRVLLRGERLDAASLLATLKEELAQGKPNAIAVVAGPGTFSAVRLGVIYANILARWYRIPLFSLPKESTVSTETLQVWYEQYKAGAWTPVGYVPPEYDREPNITTPSHDLFAK
jgi:tRNA A37 threonylcarbamoyladenosine modification protein TsaB